MTAGPSRALDPHAETLDAAVRGEICQMAYSEVLAVRIRAILSPRSDVDERPMFGGLTFMVAGAMACGVVGEDLMVRLGTDATTEALRQPHVRPMDFTGRPATGAVYVAPPGVADDRDLARWVTEGVAYALARGPRTTR